MTGATILFDLVVDAQGEVTSVRPVSFAMRNDAKGLSFSATDLTSVEPLLGRITAGSMTATGPPPRHGFPNGPAMVRDLDLMLKAASAALTQWRFAPPAAAPAIARVPAQFDLSAGQATAGRVEAISGFAGTAGAQMSTFVARSGPPSDDGALRVGGVIKPPQKIVNVNPVYPQEAQDAKVQGVVIIETVIDEAGAVKEAWVLKSVPLLDEPALEAVRHWRYEPTLMNGVPRAVRMTVTVNFTLAP
jgi:TonB family protein